MKVIVGIGLLIEGCISVGCFVWYRGIDPTASIHSFGLAIAGLVVGFWAMMDWINE